MVLRGFLPSEFGCMIGEAASQKWCGYDWLFQDWEEDDI